MTTGDQTVWRMLQSAANSSPSEFPVFAGKYREYFSLSSRSYFTLRLKLSHDEGFMKQVLIQESYEQGISRD